MPRNEPPQTERSKLELLKETSDYLRGDLPEKLANGLSHVDEEGYQLLKFSGMYQQDDRDRRKELRSAGKERAYSFMIRSRLPGGVLSAEQYLVHDSLASEVGNGTLRFTTRQGVQLHGVLKGDLKPTLQALNDCLVSTLSACGDVNRNVMACPAPERSRQKALVQSLAQRISDHLTPRSSTYFDLWLDGEKQKLESAPLTPPVDAVEPIYGKTYLPRKFKIGIAFPEDNCVDVFTQDIGIVPVLVEDELQGYNLLVGGGLGMSHAKPDTFPRLGDPLGFVGPDEILKAVEVIVTIQRDFGNRENRKQARMKYLIHAWGIERFRSEFEARFGHAVGPWVEVGAFRVDDHLGVHEGGDGRYYYGIPIENGRIYDDGEVRLKTGLRRVAERWGREFRITPQHNLLVTDLSEEEVAELQALLRDHGVKTKDEISKARRYGIACPALPTCGLALAESERVFPGIIDGLEHELGSLGLEGGEIAIRMTGCPNGCARPYSAELAFVGRSLDLYNIYVGGSFEGTRLAQEYAELVHRDDLVRTVKPLFERWRRARRDAERFGDFCHRVGLDALREAAPSEACS